jgi:hypothetical protein
MNTDVCATPRLLAPIASPPVSGFITSGRLAAPTLHNEAESGSLALRLTGSPRGASPHGLLRLTLARLPVEWAIDRVSSFQLTRSARLILALHTLSFMYAPREFAQHPCHRVLSVACPGFLTVADIKGDVGATREFGATLRLLFAALHLPTAALEGGGLPPLPFGAAHCPVYRFPAPSRLTGDTGLPYNTICVCTSP